MFGPAQPAFKHLLGLLQRGKGLEGYAYIDGCYLLAIDGTGYFSSANVHCPSCCIKHHRDGRVTYYHQILAAVIVHPEHSEVFPLAPEPILKSDGRAKNDCEQLAAKRLIRDLRREHPHLKLIVVQDGLSSNAPHIRHLEQHDMHYILVAKPGDHTFLFNQLDNRQHVQKVEMRTDDGVRQQFQYVENVSLNASNPDVKVNFLVYCEVSPNGQSRHFSWVTDLPLNETTIMKIMRAGRWRIENETFNTLKNHGYALEHNFGHGKQHLSTIFAYLIMLVFLVDQIQLRACKLFQSARRAAGRTGKFWDTLRNLALYYNFRGWKSLYECIARQYKSAPFAFGIDPDTS